MSIFVGETLQCQSGVLSKENQMESSERSSNCKDVFSLLSQYLDLELPPTDCQEIEAHLADCPPCIEFTESLRKTVELCHQYRSAELPDRIGKQAREQLLEAYRRALVRSQDDDGGPPAA